LNKSLALSRGIRYGRSNSFFTLLVALCSDDLHSSGSAFWSSILADTSGGGPKNIVPEASPNTLSRCNIQLVSGIGGLIGSYYGRNSTGATIVLVAMAFFGVSFVIKLKSEFQISPAEILFLATTNPFSTSSGLLKLRVRKSEIRQTIFSISIHHFPSSCEKRVNDHDCCLAVALLQLSHREKNTIWMCSPALLLSRNANTGARTDQDQTHFFPQPDE